MFTSLYALLLVTDVVAMQPACPQMISLSLTPKNGHINIHYDFPDDVKTLTLGLPAHVVDTMSGNGNSLIVKGDEVLIRNVAAGNTKATVNLYPLNRYENATYTPFMPLGESFAVYLPYIIPEKLQNSKNEWVQIKPECVSVNINSTKKLISKDSGFYFHSSIESEDIDHSNGIDFHFSSATPQWIQSLIEKTTTEVFGLFSQKMGKLKQHTKILVSYTESERSFYDGGVAGDTLIIRFGGQAWKNIDPSAQTQIKKFVTHEAFHFWNADDGTLPTWFKEGSADYVANYLTSASKSEFSSDNAVKKLDCMLLHGGTESHVAPDWRARYVCGQAFWAGLFENPDDFFNFWRKKQNNKSSTDLVFFLNNITPLHQHAMKVMLDKNPESTLLYGAYLTLTGKIHLAEDAPELRRLVLHHLMASGCKGMVSFTEFPEYVEFYNQEGCSDPFAKPLPPIYQINNLAISTSPMTLLRSYLSECTENGRVTLSGKTQVLVSACHIPLSLPEKITIGRP